MFRGCFDLCSVMHHPLHGDKPFRGKNGKYLHKEPMERISMDTPEIGKGVMVDGTHAGQPLICRIVFR